MTTFFVSHFDERKTQGERNIFSAKNASDVSAIIFFHRGGKTCEDYGLVLSH